MRNAIVRQLPLAPRLWSVSDVSTFLGIPVGTLYQWRHRGLGPRARKVGRHLRYDPADVQAWLDEAA
jgi:predicted DNA-binding transcriptional regulator AlpA